MSSAQYDARRRELAAIHLAKKQLGLDDDEYRDLLEAWTSKRSAGDLTGPQRQRVIEHFRKMGFERTAPSAKRAALAHVQPEDAPPVAKLKAMWLRLHKLGAVRDGSIDALNRWVKRQTGVSHVNWLFGEKLTTATESLKRWVARIERGAPTNSA